jgi:hypothetical protein
MRQTLESILWVIMYFAVIIGFIYMAIRPWKSDLPDTGDDNRTRSDYSLAA